ncbi:MAG: colanic acid biosynthesis acetyltransferase WcaF [Phycisphaerales bacterium]|nr:colanic acid biosynthesis acetyltransferase WcaF [Phycisphaerales bacterium]
MNRAWWWRLVGRRAFAWTPHTAHGLRRRVLRAFGARLAGSVKIRRSVRIDRPWNLAAGHLTIFGDHAALRLAETVTIGERCVISQYAVLATEMVDPVASDPASGRLVSKTGAIVIGDDCWVAADALVLPGSRIEKGTVVGARSLVDGDLPGWSVAVGEPARAIKSRAFVNAV